MRSLCALVSVGLVVSFSGCQSAGGPKPQIPSAPLPEALQSWVGQRRFIAGAGEAKGLALEVGESLPRGDCDVAVEVRSASFDKGTVTLSLDTLGRAETSDRMRGRECREVPTARQLSVSGLSAPEDAPQALEDLLTPPEGHLAARDVVFDLPPEKNAPKLAAAGGDAAGTSEERILGRQIDAWPRLLLAVHPIVSGHVRHQGEIEFAAMVGADGRLYKPALVTSLGSSQEEQVLKVFSLWRYEPAKRGQDRVAARVRGRATLLIR